MRKKKNGWERLFIWLREYGRSKDCFIWSIGVTLWRVENIGLNLKGSLRELINKEKTLENIVAIYQQLIMCLKHWKNRLSNSDKEDWKYDVETMIEGLECACPDLRDSELSYEEEEESLNYYLREFYDLCDNARVWIGV